MITWCLPDVIIGGIMTALVVTRQSSTGALEKFLLGFVVLASLFAIGQRLHLSAVLPLWLDETWSAMISTQTSWADLLA
jgi:hypothetical protein